MGAGKQFLVTGSTGFMGRYVVRRLLADHLRVRVFCRDPQKARRLFGEQVEIVAGDLRDPQSAETACRGAEIVIHAGGAFQFGRGTLRVATETNVAGTKHLLEAAQRQGVTRFVHVSSSGVLQGGSGLLKEKDFPSAVSEREPYRRSKWLGELAALEAVQTGLPVTIASPTSPLGAEDEAPTPTGRIVRDFLHGRFPFGARVAMNFIHVDELAAGILAVAARGRVGERYLLGHHNVWLDDFLKLLARLAALPAPRLAMPRPVIALGGVLGELAGNGRLCWETAAHAQRRQWFDFSKAAEELDWRPGVSLEATAREALEWFRHPNGEQLLAETHVIVS